MTATLQAAERITITDHVIDEARSTAVPRGSTLMLRTPEGDDLELPRDIQLMLLGALSSIADHGEVTIGRVPDVLTSSVAADLLSVSRPTLMKWAHEGKIDSFKVGTHTRFAREEVMRMRQQLAERHRTALDELRAFEDEHGSALSE